MKKRSFAATFTPQFVNDNQNAKTLLVGEDRADAAAIRLFAYDEMWPNRTNECCLYDLHQFDGVPWGYPTRFDAKTGKYHVKGFFCSCRCAREYLLQKRSSIQTMDFFERFCKTVYKVDPRKIVHPPPLDHLAQLIGQFGEEKGVQKWRQTPLDPSYIPVCEIAGLFIRVAQAYEENCIREQKRIRHEMQLDQLHQKPQPIMMTAAGRAQQINYVKQQQAAVPELMKTGVGAMMNLSIQPVKKKMNS